MKELEITCNHCGNKQFYSMKSKFVPKRPKTQCKKCKKWIYLDWITVFNFFRKDQRDQIGLGLVKKKTKNINDIPIEKLMDIHYDLAGYSKRDKKVEIIKSIIKICEALL